MNKGLMLDVSTWQRPYWLNVATPNEQKSLIFAKIWQRMEAQNWVSAGDLGEAHRYKYQSEHVSPLGALIPNTNYQPWLEELPCWSSTFWRDLALFPPSSLPMIEDLECLFSSVNGGSDFRNLAHGISLLNNLQS